MNTVKITTSQNIELEYELASLGERIVAYIIDGLIIAAYVVVVLIILFQGSFINNKEWSLIFFFIPILFYDLASEVFMNGQSVGKKAMNIKVISLDGSQPTLGQYLLRWLFRIVDFALTYGLCALISVAVSERKQRIGDMIAGTTLVKTITRTAFQHTMYVPTVETDHKVLFPEVVSLADKDMQLVKEVINNIKNTGNTWLGYQAAEKVKKTLNIKTDMEPISFLQALLADYNHLTSKV